MDAKKKLEREKYGPGWVEVIFGAVLSFGLGVVLSAVILVLKPSEGVKAMPKEPVKGVVYYVEGSKDSAKARLATNKRATFVKGGSVSLSEEEINAILAAAAPPPPPAAAKAGAKAGDKKDAPAPSGGFLSAGTPNVRLTDGKMQVAIPCTLNVAGFTMPVTVLAVGGFGKGDSGFEFVPDDVHVGSLSADRLPALTSIVMKQVSSSVKIPDDLAEAWKKISNVIIADSQLKIAE